VITVCGAGFSDCNGTAGDGCEYDQDDFGSDVDNCGGCGTACAPAHASGVCQSGSCEIGGCAVGYVDLDQNPANGCELQCTPTGSDETACDGVDDDCDDQVDEDYVATGCGTGACAAQSNCVAGLETCTPTEGSSEGPSDAPNCIDGADNDCDGLVDEEDADCSSGMGSGGAGAGGSGSAGEAGAVAGGNGGSTQGSGGSGGNAGAAAGNSTGGTNGSSAGTSSGVGGGAGTMSNTAGTSGSGTAASGGGSAEEDAADAGGCACHTTKPSGSPMGLGLSGLLILSGIVRRRRATLGDRRSQAHASR